MKVNKQIFRYSSQIKKNLNLSTNINKILHFKTSQQIFLKYHILKFANKY